MHIVGVYGPELNWQPAAHTTTPTLSWQHCLQKPQAFACTITVHAMISARGTITEFDSALWSHQASTQVAASRPHTSYRLHAKPDVWWCHSLYAMNTQPQRMS